MAQLIMSFETLPTHNLQLPEFHPAQVPQPPVYNTAAAVAPLLKIADYLSPYKRALRKAAVAKANYEFRMYQPGGLAEKKAAWMYEHSALTRMNQYLLMQKRKQDLEPAKLSPGQIKFRKAHGLPLTVNRMDDTNPMGLNQGDVDQAASTMQSEDDPSLTANYDNENAESGADDEETES